MRPSPPLVLAVALFTGLTGFAGGLLVAEAPSAKRGGDALESALLTVPAAQVESLRQPAPALADALEGSRENTDAELDLADQAPPPNWGAAGREVAPAAILVPNRARAEARIAPESSAPRLGPLLPDLEALLEEGALGEESDRRRVELTRFVVHTWLEAGEPEHALAALELGAPDRGAAAEVARAFRKRGDKASAFDALARVFRDRHHDFRLAQELAEIDPEAALRLAEELWAGEGAADSLPVRTARAQLLARAGHRDEALALAHSLLAEDPEHRVAWELLGELDPERAIADLEQSENESNELCLADLLAGQGRADEALTLLEAAFHQGAQSSAALGRLLDLEPERALALVDETPEAELEDWVWIEVSDALAEAGRTEDAVDARYRRFAGAPWDAATNAYLREHDPSGFWSRFRDRAQGSGNDELWGDLADEYWRAGDAHLAREAWQRAHGLDPGDSEWAGKLERVAAGEAPL